MENEKLKMEKVLLKKSDDFLGYKGELLIKDLEWIGEK